MFIQKLTKTRAQATTELAVFGTIMLIILATLVRYGMIYNEKQRTQMYTFRKTLELSQRRFDGNLDGQRKFASASLNVKKSIFPAVGALGSHEPTSVEATASVLTETEGSYFGDPDDGEPDYPEDVGGTYYQIGDRMILKEEFVEPTYIRVQREKGDQLPEHPWDGMADALDGAGDEDHYDNIEAMPYRENEQYAKMAKENRYNIHEADNQALYNENYITHTTTQTVYKPPAYTLTELTQKMYEWDTDVQAVEGVYGAGGIIQDMVITTDQIFAEDRAWDSDKKN